jgi:hypothetical protein
MTDPAELPPVPEPAYQWIDDYYDGWWCMNAVPDDRYSTLDTFTAEQMRAYGLACALAERERAEKDALRYRFLRELHWSDGPMCVAMQPKLSVKLGHDCPSHERLDDAIDAAIRARGEVK